MSTTKGPTTVCDVCGKPYGAKYLTTHRRKEHGIRGGRTGIVRRTPAEMNGGGGKTAVIDDPNRFDEAVRRTAEVIEAGRGAWKEVAPIFKQAPFVVLEDDEGGIWLAERIR